MKQPGGGAGASRQSAAARHSHAAVTGLFLAGVLAAAVYASMEWLFIATKPSFMDALPLWKKLEVLVLAVLLLAGLAAAPAAVIVLYRRAGRLTAAGREGAASALLPRLLAAIPAALLASALLLMLDNFTYTVFKFGIVTSAGLTRALYLALFLGMLAYSWRAVLSWASRLDDLAGPAPGRLVAACAGLILLAYAFTFRGGLNGSGPSGLVPGGLSGGRGNAPPDVLIITGDGLSAEHMSVYGYERETTPRLKAMEKDFLFVENAFSNSGNTAGSITSLLTGKYPAETRVLYPPDILRGTDSYQHLPGIFRSLGYRTVQLGQHHYVDAFTLNLQDGFDEANGRAAPSGAVVGGLGRAMPYEVRYFLYETGGRILARLGHIFFLREMQNPYALVTAPPGKLEDAQKVEALIGLLNAPDRPPLFAHLHLMVTHGPKFSPLKQVFSKGQSMEDQEPWDINFYQDSILEFDGYVGEIVDALKAGGRYDRTVLVVSSDHGRGFNQLKPIPMMVHFPGGAHAGHLQANAQNLDLAPTVLDYLGVARPPWMAGQSLLGEVGQRPVLGVSVAAGLVAPDENDDWWVDVERSEPPFYQFEVVSVVHCQRIYILNLRTHSFDVRENRRHTRPCAEEELLAPAEAFDVMVAHLRGAGFDTSSLDRQEIVR